MFERFTDTSTAVLNDALSVATELGSRYIGPVHLLYACAAVDDATASAPLQMGGVTAESIRALLPRVPEAPETLDADALRTIGIDLDKIRQAVETTFGAGALESVPNRRQGPPSRRHPGFSPETKRALELTLQAARELHSHKIRPGHILLGLLRLDNDFIASAIEQRGTELITMTAIVLDHLVTAMPGTERQ
jgi:ATP-dependent Clp protease ATP-binding subunit ClpA